MPRALIVEPSYSDAEQLAQILRRAGFDVVLTHLAAAALTALKTERVDMVLCNSVLPDASGFALCRQLTQPQNAPALPCIMLVRGDEMQSIVESFASGAAAFLLKPWHENTVIERVDAILAAIDQPRPTAPATATADAPRNEPHALWHLDPTRLGRFFLDSLHDLLHARTYPPPAPMAVPILSHPLHSTTGAHQRAHLPSSTQQLRDMAHAIERALARHELTLHFQPIISLQSGDLAGLEALVRWQHPDRGLLPPDQFLPVAEETGLISRIGRWVMQDACRHMVAWQHEGVVQPGATISVNVSSQQLARPEFFGEIATILAETTLDPHLLVLELTETTIIENAALADSLIAAIKQLGIKFALDDFGTGYSSLSYLHRFPMDSIKIDRSFVSGLGRDHDKSEIVRMLTALGRNLGLTVTAEGVEEAAQVTYLRALQCTLAQGYWFAEPLSAAQLAAFLRRPAPWRSHWSAAAPPSP